MSLTTVQERTLVELMGSREERPLFPRSVAEDLTAELERHLMPAADRLPEGRQLWLTKGRLVNLHSRCEGFFLADELGEAVFTYGPQLAVGKVVHKAVEVGVYARTLGEAELAERALDRLRESDPRFDEYAGLLDEVERAELLGEAVRQLSWFRTAFPPLERSWNPVVEWPVRVELAGGRIVLSARPDLVLGSADQEEPMRARRLVLELKGGQDRPEQDDDARFYALVMALHHGVPPFRVVTVNLQGGTSRPQDVTMDLLRSALRRVADGAARAVALLGGEEPNLRPGKWCEWCPRSETCPVSSVRTSGEA
ncbi:MAG: PD-(D/E)XK nuclease family protein [Actinomycetota bacterium]